MRLTYSVELSPKAWVPVALLEGQLATTLAPVVRALSDKNLRQPHWQQISSIVGFQLSPENITSLTNLIELSDNLRRRRVSALCGG